MAAILVASGPRAGTRVELVDGLEIGRSAGCGIRIHDDRASRVHARFLLKEGVAILEDLGSRNGTLLNGERATGHTQLEPGDRIRIGRTFFVYEPRARLLPARYSGGLLLLDDEIAIEETHGVSGGRVARRWEEELASATRRLQAMPDPFSVSEVLAEEVVRLLRARGVAIIQVREQEETASPLVIVGLPGISLPASLLREALESPRMMQAVVDRSASMAVRELEDRPATRARLYLTPLPSAEGVQGVIVAELAIDEEVPKLGGALAALAALGGLALSGARRRRQDELRSAFVSRGIRPESPELLGDSPALRETTHRVLEAVSQGSVLRLQGEPGSGRTLLACLAHERSPGSDRPLALYRPRFPVRSGAELFGSEPSGERLRPGLLEEARGGTCVVHAFSRLPRDVQQRLLVVIERGVGVREGGQRPVDLPTRLILVDEPGESSGAPSRAIQRRMKGLGVVTVTVPPLRERDLDLRVLFEAFLARAALEVGREQPPTGPELMRELQRRSWPGNLIELRALAAAALLETPPGLPLVLPGPGDNAPVGRAGQSLPEQVAALEEATIRATMEAEGGRKSRVARRLGISRPTLDRKLARFGF